ncbi:unnamed protein product [Adineta steineri]|uniref:Transmembrane protein n=1 Tax=Adineta steineri TaxID=433720 RepID=A0A815G599_9BILA|nr:unnamed protein product [Adineta steineri]
MSTQSSNHWQNELSIQNENTRFASMFILFTFLAFTMTIISFIFVNNSNHNETEIVQSNNVPYYILASISIALFVIFFIGSLVYTRKSIRRMKSSMPLPPPPRLILNSIDESMELPTDV